MFEAFLRKVGFADSTAPSQPVASPEAEFAAG
jgi:hypothetical protein